MLLDFFNKNKNFENTSRYDFKFNLKKFNKLKKNKKLIMGVTVGRSGMKWVLEILKAHNRIYGGGERNKTCESFFRYANHNKLKIDQTALLNSIIYETINDWENNDISFQLSPYFSHSIDLINKFLKPDGYIWGTNNFLFTVQSFYNKNWYNPDYNMYSIKNIPGFSLNDALQPSHFFGRIAPIDYVNKKWNNLSRPGKIAWYINYTNQTIYNSLKKIDKKKKFVFILKKGDQNYEFYLKLREWLKLKEKLPIKKFLKIKYQKSTEFHIKENKVKKFNSSEMKDMKPFMANYNKIYHNIYNLIKY